MHPLADQPHNGPVRGAQPFALQKGVRKEEHNPCLPADAFTPNQNYLQRGGSRGSLGHRQEDDQLLPTSHNIRNGYDPAPEDDVSVLTDP
jgi:hypothetical protein